MLGPASETLAEAQHPGMFDLAVQSAQLWQSFAADLEAASSLKLGYRRGPSLMVARNQTQLTELIALGEALTNKKMAHDVLGKAELKARAPHLADNLLGGLVLPEDGQVDNRRVLEALISVLPEPQPANVSHFGAKHDVVLDATGWVNGHCAPVKGQMLSLTLPPVDIPEVIRCGHTYIVPKADRIVIGATSEPGLSDTRTDRETIFALRRAAVDVCPPLHESAFIEMWAGTRPVTEDGAPVLAGSGHTYVATGHGRNGILLAPITAKIMADMILDGETSDLAAAFGPDRFAPATA